MLRLIREAMISSLETSKGFLIDGYPREVDQAVKFEEQVSRVGLSDRSPEYPHQLLSQDGAWRLAALSPSSRGHRPGPMSDRDPCNCTGSCH